MDFIPESGSAAGLELTVMRRAEMFRAYLGVNCYLVTHTYQPRIAEYALSQIEMGRIAVANLANLYDFLQGINRGGQGYEQLSDHFAIPDGWTRAERGDGPGDFLLDESGEIRRYRCYEEGAAVPSYVNFIEDGQVVSRHIYDPLGFLSREESLNTGLNKIAEARYYRPDGTLALYEHYKVQSPKEDSDPEGSTGAVSGAIDLSQIEDLPDLIEVYAPDGKTVAREFHYKDELIAWWLLQLLHDHQTHYLVISDHALQFQRYFIELKRQRADYPNVTVVESTHNCHCIDPSDPIGSQLGDNYLFLEDERQLTELVVTQTKRQAEEIDQRFPAHSYALGSIPNPITELKRTPGYLAPARSRLDIAVVGRLMAQKGIDYALEAFHLLLKSVPNARLHIFGDGPLAGELKTQAVKLGIASKVTFHGFRVNMRQAMEAFACLWCTSRHEGFTRVIQEALSVGTPVIAFDCRYGPSEMIQDGINGYLIAPGYTKTLAQRTAAFLKDHRLQKKMQKAAPKSVAHHSPQQVAEQWAQLLLPILEQDMSATTATDSTTTAAVAVKETTANEPAAIPANKGKSSKVGTKKKSVTPKQSANTNKESSSDQHKQRQTEKTTVKKVATAPKATVNIAAKTTSRTKSKAKSSTKGTPTNALSEESSS